MAPTIAQIREAFAVFDTDKSGTINRKELKAVLMRPTKSGTAMTEVQVDDLLANFDENKDGVLDTLEFAAAITSGAIKLEDAGSAASGGSDRRHDRRGAGKVRATGVGMSFEYHDAVRGRFPWKPIVEKNVIDQLGRLCGMQPGEYRHLNQVEYQHTTEDGGTVDYVTTQGSDGYLTQKNAKTGTERPVRMTPFFFEFKEKANDWRPITDPEVLMSLTAVLASSAVKTYSYVSTTTKYHGTADATLQTEAGLIEQVRAAERCPHAEARLVAPPPPPLLDGDGAPHELAVGSGEKKYRSAH